MNIVGHLIVTIRSVPGEFVDHLKINVAGTKETLLLAQANVNVSVLFDHPQKITRDDLQVISELLERKDYKALAESTQSLLRKIGLEDFIATPAEGQVIGPCVGDDAKQIESLAGALAALQLQVKE